MLCGFIYPRFFYGTLLCFTVFRSLSYYWKILTFLQLCICDAIVTEFSLNSSNVFDGQISPLDADDLFGDSPAKTSSKKTKSSKTAKSLFDDDLFGEAPSTTKSKDKKKATADSIFDDGEFDLLIVYNA